MSAAYVLRTNTPEILCANLGPRDALPIPAPSGRPVAKGAGSPETPRAGEYA